MPVETILYPQLHLVPGLLLGIDAVDLLLFSHLHIGFVALSEIVNLHKKNTSMNLQQKKKRQQQHIVSEV